MIVITRFDDYYMFLVCEKLRLPRVLGEYSKVR